MLSRRFRLPSSVSLRNSRVLRENLFIVKFQKNDLDYSRYGFVVAKTIDKRAVARNHIKRLVRSCIEDNWLSGPSGWDVLFLARPMIKNVLRENMEAAVSEAMAKIS